MLPVSLDCPFVLPLSDLYSDDMVLELRTLSFVENSVLYMLLTIVTGVLSY
jgi:hypothetical protein